MIELGEAAAFINLVDLAMLGHVAAVLEANPGAVVAVNVSGATIEHAVNELLAEATCRASFSANRSRRNVPLSVRYMQNFWIGY